MHPIRYETTYGGGDNELGSLLIAAISLVFVAAVIYGLVVLIGRYARSQNTTDQQEQVEPIDIAKTRYARGDITKEQFDQLKKDLTA